MAATHKVGLSGTVRLLALLLAAGLSACATVTPGEIATAERLKSFRPTTGWVSLYVCREQAYLAAAGVRSRIVVDNDEIGVLKPNMFAHVWLPPGKHGVLVRNDGLASGTGGLESFDGKPGDIVYYWVGVTGKGFGTLTVDRFDSVSEAKACVAGAAYAAGQTGATPPMSSPVGASMTTEVTAPPPASVSNVVPPASGNGQPVGRPTAPVAGSAIRTDGQDSYQVERMTEVKACAPAPRAELAAKGAGFETYKVSCQSGDALIVRCELGRCRVLK